MCLHTAAHTCTGCLSRKYSFVLELDSEQKIGTICIGRAEVIYLCMIIIHFFALKTFNFDAEVHDERKYERNKSGEKINDEILSLVS